MNENIEASMVRALNWLAQQGAPDEYYGALQEAVAAYDPPKAETVRREQQPAGDGEGHAATLRTMIHIREDGEDCVCAECRAVKFAIAALTAAGRGGEAVYFLRRPKHPDPSWIEVAKFDFDKFSGVQGYEARILYAAAPQQPPPVGVTDAMVDAAERAYSKALQDPNAMRIALAAALSNQQAAPSVSEAEYQAELAGDPALDGWFPGGARPAPTTPAAPEPAASGEGYIMPFDLPRYDFHKREDAHWAVWTPVPSQFGEWCRYRDVITAPRRFTTGQGDVERLVEAARVVAEQQDATLSVEWDQLDAALRPFGQQQEGRG